MKSAVHLSIERKKNMLACLRNDATKVLFHFTNFCTTWKVIQYSRKNVSAERSKINPEKVVLLTLFNLKYY